MLIGILAGIWPCGIITLADELFLTESKSQVYGCIHSLIHANPTTTSEISKLGFAPAVAAAYFCVNMSF